MTQKCSDGLERRSAMDRSSSNMSAQLPPDEGKVSTAVPTIEAATWSITMSHNGETAPIATATMSRDVKLGCSEMGTISATSGVDCASRLHLRWLRKLLSVTASGGCWACLRRVGRHVRCPSSRFRRHQIGEDGEQPNSVQVRGPAASATMS